MVELIVVVSIVALLSTVILANYRGGEKQFALKRAAHKLAQDLRLAQTMAMSSKKFEDVFPKGGYGIRFQNNSDSYILFADCDNDDEFDAGGTAPNCNSATPQNPYSELVQEFSLEQGIKITSLFPSGNTLFIVFFPPDPTITINPDAVSASIALGFDGQSITVSINKAGLIEIQ